MGRRRELITIGACAGAIVAFPLGLYFGRPSTVDTLLRARANPASLRGHYAPAILSDPYVLDQWRRSVEALEASCRASGRYCTEAGSARIKLVELEGAR
jgi:hypothetical protein